MKHPSFHRFPDLDSQSFLLQRVQPGLSGLMDGSLSTLRGAQALPRPAGAVSPGGRRLSIARGNLTRL